MRSLRVNTKYLLVLALIGLLSGAMLLGLFGRRPIPSNTAPHQPLDARTKAQVSAVYGELPIHFEANCGQADSPAKFVARGPDYQFVLRPEGAKLALRKRGHTATASLSLKLVDATPQPQMAGLEELPGKVNYFIGNDPKKWRTGIPTYAKVRYERVYPGIDLLYYGNQNQLEYDFIVAPGADPNLITLAFEGAEQMSIEANGDLVLHTADGEVRQREPIIYQEVNGLRQEVPGCYVLKGKHQVGFQVGDYDAARPLVIDPVLIYSTFLGINSTTGEGIAVDSDGNAYLTSKTSDTAFPTIRPYAGGGTDAFVAKFNPTGSTLLFFTYFGGSGEDRGDDIALDSSGNAYVTGITDSTDFPTVNPFQPTYSGGNRNGFVAKLSANGSTLVYSTYLGGNQGALSSGIAVDATGHAYIIGQTDSTDFPITPGAFQTFIKGSADIFVVKFSVAGSALDYSTFLGGSARDFNNRIAVDSAGNAYLTGFTVSTDFPTRNAIQPVHGGGERDGFVAKLNANGSDLVFSTYLGGSGGDESNDIALGTDGIYVVGMTDSTNFPTTANVVQPASNGGLDAFIVKLNNTGSALVFSTYLGGSSDDGAGAFDVDSAGNTYVTGFTESTNFPTASPLQPIFGGVRDSFALKLNATGSVLVFSTYLGGSDNDGSGGIAVDNDGNAYVTGLTRSSNFPTTPGSFQPTKGGSSFNAFVVKIGEAPDLAITKTSSPNPVVTGSNVTYTITLTNNGPNAASSVVVTDNLPAATTFVSCATTGGGVCGGSGNNRTITFATLAAGASATITLVATVNCSVADGTMISNTATVSSATPDPNPSNNSATAMTTASNPPPMITCPPTICVTATPGQTSTVVTYATPAATDNCPGQPTVACSPPSGSSFPLGLSTVTCTATDAVGNSAACSFPVAVNGTLFATRDSYLRGNPPNTNLNEGANERLRIQRTGPYRAVVGFDLTVIPLAGLKSAQLVLNIASNDNNWGTGRLVDAQRLLVNWTEGNGRNEINVGGGSANPGTGAGITWNCASDSNISNNQANCAPQWNGATNSIAAATAPGVLHTNNLTGNVSWNVTTDVSNGANFGWLIKKREENQNGQVQYQSREGAAGNANLVPRLVLVYCP